MNPKISIIVPIWNVEKYLDRCIQSILNQTLKDIEIILVDDESPDNCPQMCDNYAKIDSRVKVIHKKNRGLGMARNSGLDIASGEYVTFPDPDDYIDVNTLEYLYQYAKNNSLDAVYYEFNTDEYPGYKIKGYPEGIYEGKSNIEAVMLDMIGSEPEWNSDVKFQVSACKALYKLDIIHAKNLKFVSERELICEDLVWNIHFLNSAYKISYINKDFYHYCLNNYSLSHVFRTDRYKKLCTLREYIDSLYYMFDNKEYLILRNNRSRLFDIRTTTLSLIKSRKSISKALKEINQIVYTNKDLFKSYPLKKMRLRYRLFFHCITNKLYLIPFLAIMVFKQKIWDMKKILL